MFSTTAAASSKVAMRKNNNTLSSNATATTTATTTTSSCPISPPASTSHSLPPSSTGGGTTVSSSTTQPVSPNTITRHNVASSNVSGSNTRNDKSSSNSNSINNNGRLAFWRKLRQPPAAAPFQAQQPAASSRQRKFARGAAGIFHWDVPVVYVFILAVVVLLQLIRQIPSAFPGGPNTNIHQLQLQQQQHASMVAQYGGMGALSATRPLWDYVNNPLSIPIGQPPIIPGTATTGVPEKELLLGASPKVWKLLVKQFNIHSVLTVHCGRGISTAWFLQHGVQSLCIEGNLQNLQDSVLTDVVPHDYMAGPWWPAVTYDAAWVTNLLEHIPTQYMHHYIATLKKVAVVFVTTGSSWDATPEEGHIEVHNDAWWIAKMSLYGFVYDESLTKQVRDRAATEDCVIVLTQNVFHICRAGSLEKEMLVFLNPAVASLPQHAHLFFEHGCVDARNDTGQLQRRPCGGSDSNRAETPLPDTFLHPIPLNSEQDGDWRNLVKVKLEQGDVSTAGLDLPSPAAAKAAAKVVPAPVITEADRKRQKKEAAENELLRRIATGNLTGLPTITVVAWPYVEHGIKTAEHLHLSENGIQESPYLRLAKSMTDFGSDHDPQHVVWVGDTGWGAGWMLWCNTFLQRLMTAREERAKKNKKYPLSWPVYIIDFTDYPAVQRCPDVEDFMGKEFVFYSTRSLGLGRQWDESSKWVKVGRRMRLNKTEINYLHTPLVVRTDTIQSLHDVLTKQRGLNLHDPIEDLIPRPVDVTHFWPLDTKKVSDQFANLRFTVSHIVAELGKPPHNLNVFVGIKGEAVRQGRRGVRNEYIDGLLDSKIIVVTQRDEWEDHYRLFEAIAGGAMVMTDFMHGLPAGLKNGTSVIEFASGEQLRDLILYYVAHDDERIAIAREGRKIAMSRHRSWHRMEEIIFGQVASVCTSKDPHRKCPYIVHGEEKDTR